MGKATLAACLIWAATSMGCGGPSDNEAGLETITSRLTGCVPGDGQVSFFMGPDGSGSCITLGYGAYAFPDDPYAKGYFGLPNDSIQAVKVGTNARAVIFINSYFGGNKSIITRDTYYVVPTTSSIRVERPTDTCESSSFRPGAGAVALYTNANFGGDCVVI